MARARLLKIGFFENEDLARLPDKARLLFAGLWLIADRAGRVQDRPLWIKAQLFPYEDVDIEPLLEQLTAKAFIVRYQGEHLGELKRVISIPKFLTHQTPHHREADSNLPAKPKSLGSAEAMPGLSREKAGPSPSVSVSVPVSVPVAVSEAVAISTPHTAVLDVARALNSQTDPNRDKHALALDLNTELQRRQIPHDPDALLGVIEAVMNEASTRRARVNHSTVRLTRAR